MTNLSHIKCFILDMDGTIYLGNKIFPSVYPFFERLRQNKKDFFFFTNNSSKNTDFYLQKLSKLGIDIPREKMLISNQVCIAYLKKQYENKKVYVIGTSYLIEELKDGGIQVVNDESADLVVLGFDTSLTYEKLQIGCDLVRNGKPIIGVNPDFNCPVENGFIPDCGSMAKLIEASTGVQIAFLGKPSRHTLEYIIRYTGYKEEELAFVGDRLYTDIAIASGTKATSILVLTGETKREDLENAAVQPDVIIDSIGDLLRG